MQLGIENYKDVALHREKWKEMIDVAMNLNGL